jgi:hypothetical protein
MALPVLETGFGEFLEPADQNPLIFYRLQWGKP